MNIKRKLFFILILLLLLSNVSAMKISGTKLLFRLDFESGLVQENSYNIINQEGYTSDYKFVVYQKQGADLSPYFTVTPSTMVDVEPNEVRPFTLRLELPEQLDTPGLSEAWVMAEIETTKSGVIKAYPSVGIRYFVFVLYPWKYAEFSFSPRDMNLDETVDLVVNLENLGEPIINSAGADIDIINLETGLIVKSLKTERERNIEPKEVRSLKSIFNSVGLTPGNYMANATIYWDGNVTYKQGNFRIGSKNVLIHEFTNLFEIDSINKMEITIESAWNSQIDNIYADVEVYEKETEQKVAEFKTFDTDLKPWETKSITGYFDTTGLSKKNYTAKILLKYEGATTEKVGEIKVDENIGAEIVEEEPFSFGINISELATPMNLLILLLMIFLVLNGFLLVSYVRNKKNKEVIVDPEVINHIKEMKKKYNDSYVTETLIKKGWSKDKIKYLLKEAEKDEKKR